MTSREHSDRILVVLSDIEMGAGGPQDDFPHSDFLEDLILSYNQPRYAQTAIDLVFNGDTFDLLKTSHLGRHPHHINSTVAMAKMARVAAAHPHFFEGLRRFLQFQGARRTVHFTVGNHDPEILFPEVQGFIRSLCNNSERVLFPGFEFNMGAVHIEHGAQHDPLFVMDSANPFVEHEGQRLLNIPWASVAIMDVVLPYQKFFYHLDRLKPKRLLLEMLPEAKEWLLGSFWKYWTRDFLRDYMRSTDPFKRVTWEMIKEIVRRFSTASPDISIGDRFHTKFLTKDGAQKLAVVGHVHETGWWSNGNRKVIQTGCFRNEFMIEDGGKRLEPIAKTFAEIHLCGERIVRTNVIEIEAPPVPQDYIPMSLAEFAPVLRSLIGSREEQSKRQLAIEAQEKKESSNKSEARA